MSRMQRALLFLACTLALTVASAVGMKAGSQGAEEAAIRAADAQWAQAASAKDLERTLSFYADDAVLPWPNAPAATGKGAIRAIWAAEFKDPAYSLSWRAEEVVVASSGDLAYSRGSYDATYTPGEHAVRERGKYLAIWKKQPGGTWKVAVDMYNPDAPAVPINP
jgi:uncharacterized protein (TIGR02246 family)